MQLIEQIKGGELDSELTAIIVAAQKRRRILQNNLVGALEPGDRVVLAGQAKYPYRGRVAIVKWVNEKTVTMLSSSPAFSGTSFSRASHVRVPKSWMGERVTA